MAPTPKELQVAIEALYEESAVWRGNALVMAATAQAVWRLGLGTFQLSWAAEVTGLARTYATLQERLAGQLAEAEQAFDDIGRALRTAADGYRQDEEDGIHRLRNIYSHGAPEGRP